MSLTANNIMARTDQSDLMDKTYSPGRGGGIPGYIGMCGPRGYGFSAFLVINRVSILAILPPFCIRS